MTSYTEITDRFNSRMNSPSQMLPEHTDLPTSIDYLHMAEELGRPSSSSITHMETKTDRQIKSTAWCFTSFDADALEGIYTVDGVIILCIAREYAPSTGREHYQGYIRFATQRRLSALMKIAPGVHWEVRRGTEQHAVEYIVDVEAYNRRHPDLPPKEQGDILVRRGKPAVQVSYNMKPLERAADMISRGAPLWQVHKEIGPYTFMMHAQKLRYYSDQIAEWRENGINFLNDI